MIVFDKWIKKWQISTEAVDDLRAMLNPTVAMSSEEHGETYVQSNVRLEASKKGICLWRNNVGVLNNDKGIPIRFGLGNDSKIINSRIKSADLIGWRRILITNDMVGNYIAQFVSRECKKSDWVFTGSDREIAQLNWAIRVIIDGGDASFCTGIGTL